MEDKELIIHSELIIKALRAIVDYYPGQSLLGNTVSIKEPFSILVHFRKKLQEYKESCDDAKTYHHIGVLQKYLEGNLGDKILEEDQRYTKPTPVATFEMLRMLFKPGIDVYAQIDDQLMMWYFDFDGRMAGRRPHEVTIAPFEGEREITSLKVFPAKFLDSNTELSPRKRLEDRGEKFYSILMGKQIDYKGYNKHPALNLGIDDGGSGILAGLQYDCNCDECMDTRRAASGNAKWGSYENIDPRDIPSLAVTMEDGSFDRHRYFLCPRRIMGFDLKSKKWQALDVDCCRASRIKTEAIENLVLPSDKQEFIKALDHKYSSSRNKKNSKAEATWLADPISNKGEGQIFLFHGLPGAGKTFTAECVAEFTSRPLLSLTCCDIGTDEFTVEESLSKRSKLAKIWGVVMLIDEADVYLERCEVNELTRNGLVSVFSRAMEYYCGILFLITNRVGHFDPAFFSKIYVYIGYKPFDSEGRKRI
ncbi:hypothetical protein G7Y89_g8889 [Cudoniella acicularis]|uniref:AAA+ ATPase domain-containing protein n=1 Tax=Cudoniella acicularis TaxID=354080 RepID=A0A8H4RFQ3_9HELO|nr:hypothetical protein G7Y89_g8889 [Cudoniella acicularis]